MRDSKGVVYSWKFGNASLNYNTPPPPPLTQTHYMQAQFWLTCACGKSALQSTCKQELGPPIHRLQMPKVHMACCPKICPAGAGTSACLGHDRAQSPSQMLSRETRQTHRKNSAGFSRVLDPETWTRAKHLSCTEALRPGHQPVRTMLWSDRQTGPLKDWRRQSSFAISEGSSSHQCHCQWGCCQSLGRWSSAGWFCSWCALCLPALASWSGVAWGHLLREKGGPDHLSCAVGKACHCRLRSLAVLASQQHPHMSTYSVSGYCLLPWWWLQQKPTAKDHHYKVLEAKNKQGNLKSGFASISNFQYFTS